MAEALPRLAMVVPNWMPEMPAGCAQVLAGYSPEKIAVLIRDDGVPLDVLIEAFTPVVQARVARALLRRGASARGRDIGSEVEDMTQEVFVALFEDGARVLKSWRPDRGLSLANYVGLVAEREVASILRSSRRSPWTEDPTLNEDLDLHAEPQCPIDRIVSESDLIARLLDRLRESLSPLGYSLFEKLFVDERSVAEVAEDTGMSQEALYAWSSRLRKLTRKMAGELMSDPSGNRRIPV